MVKNETIPEKLDLRERHSTFFSEGHSLYELTRRFRNVKEIFFM